MKTSYAWAPIFSTSQLTLGRGGGVGDGDGDGELDGVDLLLGLVDVFEEEDAVREELVDVFEEEDVVRKELVDVLEDEDVLRVVELVE